MRTIIFGTYDTAMHPRIATIAEGLAARGFDVTECNVPLGLTTADRVEMLAKPWKVGGLVARLASRWLALAARARRLGRHNLALLNLDMQATPIVFLEPSCYSMFVEDYRELNLPGSERVAGRCFLFEQFIENLLAVENSALHFRARSGNVMIHPHCHVKSLMNPAFLRRLALRLPGRQVTLLDSGCCGMAGAFGALSEKYELSLKVAEPLLQKIQNLSAGTAVVASGTSCRHQIAHLAPVRPRHMAELLAAALETE